MKKYEYDTVIKKHDGINAAYLHQPKAIYKLDIRGKEGGNKEEKA